MTDWSHLRDFRVVRLNARLSPVSPLEARLYDRYDLRPILAEANSVAELIPVLADCDALFAVSVALPAPVIASLHRCKLISRLGNGTDKIDVAEATRRGILVTNVPYFCVDEMADHAMGLLLMLARRIPQMSRYMLAGAYPQARAESLQLRRVSHCVLGIVGFGASGQALAKRARACGMRVLATRKRMASRDEADALGVELVDFETVLTESDYVSLHLPLSSETYHLIDAAALQRMRHGACLINTSRGALVDEMALAEALREGHLAGAGLDTFHGIDIFAENPERPAHPLAQLDNVILTPHVSGLSIQAAAEVTTTGVANLVTVLSGHWPNADNIVNQGVTPWAPLSDYDPALLAA